MTKSVRITLCAAFLSVAIAVPLLAQTRGMTSEDYFAFETLGDPHFSPDGSTIAFVVTTVDQKQNRRRSADEDLGSHQRRQGPQHQIVGCRNRTSARYETAKLV